MKNMSLFDEFIENVHFKKANEFLEFIRRSHDFWWVDDHCPWIFRGQWNANWKLQPAAFRPMACNELQPLYQRIRNKITSSPRWSPSSELDCENRLQFFTEIEALTQFADLARDIGLPLPRGQAHILNGDWSGLDFDRRPSLPREDRWHDQWCPDVRLMPIAQHHGVPTRLLDFSTDPILATYFAIGMQFRPSDAPKTTRIALHAFNTDSWLLKEFLSCLVVVDGIDGITETDDFISSQGGQFVFIKRAVDFHEVPGRWPAIEDVIRIQSKRIMAAANDEVTNQHRRFQIQRGKAKKSFLLRKMTLPVRQVPSLLRTLEREGTSLAHLMPTLDNVARTVMHRWKQYQ